MLFRLTPFGLRDGFIVTLYFRVAGENGILHILSFTKMGSYHTLFKLLLHLRISSHMALLHSFTGCVAFCCHRHHHLLSEFPKDEYLGCFWLFCYYKNVTTSVSCHFPHSLKIIFNYTSAACRQSHYFTFKNSDNGKVPLFYPPS